jgi:hypothetical protein
MQIEQSPTAANFAATISTMRGKDRRETVACAVIESGGLYPYPFPGSVLVEIQLHGICATGTGEDDAIENWIAAALPTGAAPAGAV